MGVHTYRGLREVPTELPLEAFCIYWED